MSVGIESRVAAGASRRRTFEFELADDGRHAPQFLYSMPKGASHHNRRKLKSCYVRAQSRDGLGSVLRFTLDPSLHHSFVKLSTNAPNREPFERSNFRDLELCVVACCTYKLLLLITFLFFPRICAEPAFQHLNVGERRAEIALDTAGTFDCILPYTTTTYAVLGSS